LAVAKPIATDLVARLQKHPAVQQVDYAGSVRRGRETVADVDLVAAASDLQAVSDAFVAQPEVREVLVHGPTKASVRLHNGLQVDLRVVQAQQFGAALQYFTGSKEHNIALRHRALARGYKLNEYGLFHGEQQVAGATEEEVYHALDLPPIPPELREARGELEAASAKQLPSLIELKDIRGDLQTHTNWSDGSTPIGDMAEAARARGYAYLGITDHSGGLRIARGLDDEQLRKQLREIDALNRRMAPFRILKGVEANIDADGHLDVAKAFRTELDFVVASVHSRFNDDRSTMTRRLVGALNEEKVAFLAHPTGRLLLERPGYEADWGRVFEAAKARGVALEINGTPNRLDLSDAQVLEARGLGCTFVVNTDAHSPAQLDYMEFGLTVARRGWLTSHDMLNTRSLDQVLRRFRA
jgi:DNA polymerase (family 10)